jgi:adenylate cyclase
MASRDPDGSVEARARRLEFDDYLLDLDRGCLLLDYSEIALRPKTFTVLKFLAENAGRLVSKDELLSAVWPDVTVTDDTLVQSIGELRRALGDDGARLIRTVPRRGYRFEATVSTKMAMLAPADPTAIAGTEPAIPALDDASKREPAIASIVANTHDDGTRSWTSDIQDRASRLLATARRIWHENQTDRLRGLLAVLAAAVLGGAAWIWPIPDLSEKAPATHALSPTATKAIEVEARPAIAILPFANNSSDADREYFSDGLTQDIINALGRFSALTVMSWNAVAPYKGKPSSPADVAGSLRVRYQVEGSVQRTGDRLRVRAQLVDTSGRVLWSGRFDEALSDLFALQDKITTQIAGALAIRVTQAEQKRVLAKPTENLEAYDLVLRARPALQRPARASIVEARALLRRAIGLDPGYAAAHVALGETYHIDVSWGWAQSPVTALSRAEELATAALQINDTELSAHILRGRIHLFYNRYEQAVAEMDRALEINPSDASGLAGRGNIQMWLGQTDAAIVSLEAAQRIDPALNAIDRFSLAMAYYLKRRYREAIEKAELNLRNSESSNFSYVVLAAAFAQLGKDADVARVASEIQRRYPTFDAGEGQVSPAARSRAFARWAEKGWLTAIDRYSAVERQMTATFSGSAGGCPRPWPRSRCMPAGTRQDRWACRR